MPAKRKVDWKEERTSSAQGMNSVLELQCYRDHFMNKVYDTTPHHGPRTFIINFRLLHFSFFFPTHILRYIYCIADIFFFFVTNLLEIVS